MDTQPKKKILIIEDDPFLSDSLDRKLSNEGFEVTIKHDGALGLEHMKTAHPDLVLLDIMLPSVSGYEILETRSQDPELTKIPVIIISNSGQPVEISRVLALGVKDYLVKAQIDPEEVVTKIRSYLADGATPAQPQPRLSGRKILWAEDDPFLSDVLSAKIGREGGTLFHAANGAEAMHLLETTVPDIILLDLVFQDISGFEILEKIKTIESLKNVPIIVLSNLGDGTDKDRTRLLGSVKHLVKAEITPDEIVREIVSTLTK